MPCQQSLSCLKAAIPATYRSSHLDQLQPSVQLGHKVGRATIGNRTDTEQTVIQGGILPDTLSEGTTLEVEDKSGDLLRKTEEVDGSVEQSGLKLFFEINLSTAKKESTISTNTIFMILTLQATWKDQ